MCLQALEAGDVPSSEVDADQPQQGHQEQAAADQVANDKPNGHRLR